MTKKNYELIALAIREAIACTGTTRQATIENIVANLCDKLLKDNPRFDMRKFCQAIYA
jgi:hypothetical protein